MPLTLPNNYTEYVPLDTLQAAQLNNDNENNQYIADNVPALEDITAATVKSSTNGNGWITSAVKSVMSVTLPAGTYLIIGSTVFNGSGQSIVASLRTSLSGSENIISQTQMATANGYYLALTPHAAVTFAAQTTVHLALNHTGGNNADLWGTNSISYIRIK